jgi:nucleoside-diphosphate-sugar epimerase
MIIAITGGEGFIGRHLIARHVAGGDQVRYLTRKKSSAIPGASAYVVDLCSSTEDLQQFVQGVDVLYHCAAELYNEAQMYNTNVQGTANLLAAANGKALRWVQLSSTGVYGIKLNADIHEDSSINPVNTYEVTKVAADNLVLTAMDKQNLQCVLLRPSNVYGVNMPNQSLFSLIKMIAKGWFFFIGEPGAKANYIHVDNVIDALVLCATADLPINGRTYIVSDHRTLEDLVAIITDALGKRSSPVRLPEFIIKGIAAIFGNLPKFPLTPSRVDALTNRHIYFTKRIESELGYKNTITMEDGISELARYANK